MSTREAVQADLFQGQFYHTGITSCQVYQLNLSLLPPLHLSAGPHVLFGFLLQYHPQHAFPRFLLTSKPVILHHNVVW